MKVCIAEKPSVAGEIAKIIGAKARKDGYYEGNGYAVTWTFGHLCTLSEPKDYNPNYKKWQLFDLPISPKTFSIKLIDNQGVEKQFNTIKHLVANCTEVINCGDAGQEGELIQRWVLEHANCNVPIKRLWISSLTEEAIKNGFKKLMDGKDFDALFEAGKSRAIGDWLYGINATRLYTLKFGEQKQVLSVGRVQTPTLAMIVRRHFEIKNFVPKDFFEVKTIYKNTAFTYTKGRFEKRPDAEHIIKEIQNEEIEIQKIDVKKGKEFPPPLFDLTSLQVEANKKNGFSADQTLKLTQSLYEKKVVTYPRVDTVYLPKDQYTKIPSILKGIKQYEHLTSPLLQKPIKKSKKVFNDNKVTDHHAIIPTGVYANNLNSDETVIYDLICKKFIAAFYPECEVSNTTVHAKVNKYAFKATGKQILDEGWRVVYKSEKKTEQKNIMPLFEQGEKGKHEPTLDIKKTSPPKEYSEATLLRAMETAGKQVEDDELKELMKENGIGRPSTRANIIETLFRRKYIEKKRKNLVPTEVGISLIQKIENPTLKSAALTGNWEKKLRDIEGGNYKSEDFLNEMQEMVDNLVKEVMYQKDFHSKLRCPKCEVGWIVQGNSAYGCSEWKNGCDFTVPQKIKELDINAKTLGSLINHKKAVLKGNNKTIYIVIDDYFQTQTITAKDLTCPKCKNGSIKKGSSAWGCSEFKKTCDFLIPFSLFDQNPNLIQIKNLLSNKYLDGKTHRIQITRDCGIEKIELENSKEQ